MSSLAIALLVSLLMTTILSSSSEAASTNRPIVASFRDLYRHASSSDGSQTVESPESTVSPAATIPSDVRAILRKVGTLPCSESVRSRVFALLYDSNRSHHDKCVIATGYQFFPYPGELPTTQQIAVSITTTACLQLYSGVMLAHFPECDISFVSVRSSAETYLRAKQTLAERHVGTTQDQFYELYNLNRVANLLNENASVIENAFRDSAAPPTMSVAELARVMRPVAPIPGVALGPDMTLVVTNDTSTKTTVTSTSGSSSSDEKASSSSSEQSGSADASTRSELPCPPTASSLPHRVTPLTSGTHQRPATFPSLATTASLIAIGWRAL